MLYTLIVGLIGTGWMRYRRKWFGLQLGDAGIRIIDNYCIIPLLIGLASCIVGLIVAPRGVNPTVVNVLVAGIPAICGIVCVAAGIYAVFGMEDRSRATRTTELMDLTQAAQYVGMPEDELLALATSGKLRTRQVNGQYHFDVEILNSVKEMVVKGV